jgi:hypothetical protein
LNPSRIPITNAFSNQFNGKHVVDEMEMDLMRTIESFGKLDETPKAKIVINPGWLMRVSARERRAEGKWRMGIGYLGAIYRVRGPPRPVLNLIT